ncbi:uncharacterized protein LOC128681246 isoform X2 [Plodia interpunctella]|uniref:uncharacterized protein LOC128681246 isoform X2 n=1 Tax=Plodia interpunctella TaxID=58824 RepID=UPI002367AE53|nr:uncharacterized protein LOC128681246 isoform X2 [Plodia interpunctella]
MLLIVLLLWVDGVRGNHLTNGSLARHIANNKRRPNKDHLLFRLRSQLMEDNYDYEPSVEKVETALRALPAEDDHDERDNHISKEEAKKDDSELSDFSVDRNVLNGYLSDLHGSGSERSDLERDVTSTPDFTPDAAETPRDEWIEVIKSFVPGSPYLHGSDTTTELPYKVLTAHGLSRRSGGVLRYLKTALNDSVVVAPFSPGPLPHFRLPKSRRQYREDSDGDNITGEDDADPELDPS